ncbi:hypothetical protein D3C81_2051150 [compost metagenome]
MDKLGSREGEILRIVQYGKTVIAVSECVSEINPAFVHLACTVQIVLQHLLPRHSVIAAIQYDMFQKGCIRQSEQQAVALNVRARLKRVNRVIK